MDASTLLKYSKIVPVVIIDDPESAVALAETLVDAGLNTIEVTLRTPLAMQAIEKIASAVPEALLGAGSIRQASQFEQAKSAGARFAVSPGASEILLDAAVASEMPFVPGAVTASEAIRLQEREYSLLKFFPAELAGGTKMLKALGAPLPEARFMPTGGITVELAGEYLALPNVSCIGGSWITPAELLANKDFKAIGKIARAAATM